MQTPPSPSIRTRVLKSLPLAVIVLALVLFFSFGLQRYLSLDSLAEQHLRLQGIVNAQPIAAAFYFFVFYAIVAALAIPGDFLFTIAGGLLFGGFEGGILTVLGATVGAVLLFLAARSSFGGWLRSKAHSGLSEIQQGFSRDAISWLLFLRLALLPFWLVNLCLSVLDVPIWRFFWTTMLGMMPATFIFAYSGASLTRVFADHHTQYAACLAAATQTCNSHIRLTSLITGQTTFFLFALAFLALLPIWLKWVKRRRSTPVY
ncbi:MAG: VTT domain-containing protein [Alphaproteobacteria bacterium]|nr:VTT domain-containing protein [Alphaproteobacteria bacterium]MBV1700930.1 VTT domain-containing protein [Hyphomicrobiales bacterium]MDE2115359.1 TVP38/TMEM64 family protein [Hyphomicrobiales bacterium]